MTRRRLYGDRPYSALWWGVMPFYVEPLIASHFSAYHPASPWLALRDSCRRESPRRLNLGTWRARK